MSIKNIYRTQKNNYNFELLEINYDFYSLYDLIITNYLRQKTLFICSDILIISNKKEFTIFYENIKSMLDYLKKFGLTYMNNNSTKNGQVKKYLEHQSFIQTDIDYILENTLHKITRKPLSTDFYDILILNDNLNKCKLKRVIKKYTKSSKKNTTILEQHFIYCTYIKRKFLDLYDKF